MELRKKLEKLKAMGYDIDDIIEIIGIVGVMEKYSEDTPKLKPVDEKSVKAVLKKIGIPVQNKGYQYTVDAILLCVEDRAAINSVTRVIYPEIAKKHATTPYRVEYAIRHGIETAWLKGNIDYQNAIFGNAVSKDKGKPTNQQFIVTLTEYVVNNSKYL